jgi:hypothetical protein
MCIISDNICRHWCVNVVAVVCLINDDIGFKRFSATNFNSYLRQHMSSLISINSDDMKGHHYFVFTNGLIAMIGSDDLWAFSNDFESSLKTNFLVVIIEGSMDNKEGQAKN